MSSDAKPAVFLRQVSKKYPIYDHPSQKLLELLSFRRKQFHREFWALQDVDLVVMPGTTLGIVGQNGSGKSTLLQIVAGILKQTRGDCFIKGTVAALLELGSGFNPEFTGRENVFMSGAIMGMRHDEIRRRFKEIIDFAEIGEFIDRPVKTYSTGMFMRLAFAVAIHVDPEILLVDEALAVGDLIFQHRCINRIRRMRDQGKTILFVTHDLQAMTRFCDRAILLDAGRKLEDGSPEHVSQKYQALIFERERKSIGADQVWQGNGSAQELPVVSTIPYVHHRYGNGSARISGIILYSKDGKVANEVKADQEVLLVISARIERSLEHPIIGFTVRDRMGVEITSSNTSYEGLHLPAAAPGSVITAGFRMHIPMLRPGSYSISPAIAQGNIWEHSIEDWIDNAYIIDVLETGLIYGAMRWPVEVSFRIS
ncbi:MAG: ABC transporter ATP-binding protein [Acidobacteria bacterium]|nr:ABC transporter ATP-binding protein [Acidobacteriota bacterium]